MLEVPDTLDATVSLSASALAQGQCNSAGRTALIRCTLAALREECQTLLPQASVCGH